MLNRSAFIMAPIALVLTVILIISVSTVFGTIIKPDTVYNTLIYEIGKDMSSSINFYNDKCDQWNGSYNLDVETMDPEKPVFYNYQICKILHE